MYYKLLSKSKKDILHNKAIVICAFCLVPFALLALETGFVAKPLYQNTHNRCVV
jgi:hypothetical protein